VTSTILSGFVDQREFRRVDRAPGKMWRSGGLWWDAREAYGKARTRGQKNGEKRDHSEALKAARESGYAEGSGLRPGLGRLGRSTVRE